MASEADQMVASATTTPAPARPAGKPAAAVVESTPDPPVNKMRRRIVWSAVATFLITDFLMFL